jgi:hypothetical protein
MPRRVLAWKCKHCGRLYTQDKEQAAIKHESACLSNPNAKNCLYCANSYRPYKNASTRFLPGQHDNDLMCIVRRIKCSKAVSANCVDFKRASESDGE